MTMYNEEKENIHKGHPWNSDKVKALRYELEKKRLRYNKKVPDEKKDPNPWTVERLGARISADPDLIRMWESGFCPIRDEFQQKLTWLAGANAVRLYLENNDLTRLREEVIDLLDSVYNIYMADTSKEPETSMEKKKQAIRISYQKCLMAIAEVDWHKYGVKLYEDEKPKEIEPPLPARKGGGGFF